MGLLDGGLQSVFGAAFGGIYLNGTLHRSALAFTGDGDVTEGTGTNPAVKAHFDRITEAMRQSAGYTEKDVAIIVLQDGVFPAPTTDDECTLGGVRWAIASVDSDPAATHWIIRGQRG